MDAVGEVEIRRKYVGTWDPVSWAHDPEAQTQMLPEDAVVAEIDTHRARGVRALLCSIESNGGTLQAARAIYDALRAFSDDGGAVVVHLGRYVASSAPLYALAGDIVIASQDTRIFLHGTRGADVEAWNAWVFSVLAARTLAPPASIARWLALSGQPFLAQEPYAAEVDAAAAIHYGFADAVGPRSLALELAAALARMPGVPSTPRRTALEAGRKAEPGPVQELQDATGRWLRFCVPVTTATMAFSVLPGQAPASVVPDSTSTRGAAVDNLWPNPSSETDPPDGVDTTTAEWAGRVNVGGSTAYNGIWVRQLTAAQNGKQSLGAPATVNGGTVNEPSTQSQLALEIPCSPNETFYVEARTRWITVTGAQACGVYIYFLNASRQNIGNATAYTPNTGGTGAGWVLSQAYGSAPAGTTSVRFICFMDSTLGAATADFDAIYARRQIDGAVVAKLGGTFVDEVQYGAMKAIGRLTSGSWPNTQVDRAWYRGSCDNGTLQGAPNISRLTVVPYNKVGTTGTLVTFACDFVLQPTAASDNLDGMRYAEVKLYSQSGTGGTSGNLTLVDTFWVVLSDRLYKVPGTDSDSGNLCRSGFVFNAQTMNIPAMLITLYNVNGPSDTHCFYPGASYTFGSSLIDNGTAWPAGITGGTAGGSGGGGNAGGACLDPETPVLVGPGRLAPLYTVRAGDLLWTRPENDGELAYHAIESVRHAMNLRCRVSFLDGRSFVCSVNHLLNVRGLWMRADRLRPGEEVQGEPSGHVRSVEYLGEGPVVQLRIPTAGTYFAGDGCWHHNTYKP